MTPVNATEVRDDRILPFTRVVAGIPDKVTVTSFAPAMGDATPSGKPSEPVVQWGPYKLSAGPASENQRFGSPAVAEALDNALAGVASGSMDAEAALKAVQAATDSKMGAKQKLGKRGRHGTEEPKSDEAAKAKSSLRATTSALRALKYLGGEAKGLRSEPNSVREDVGFG